MEPQFPGEHFAKRLKNLTVIKKRSRCRKINVVPKEKKLFLPAFLINHSCNSSTARIFKGRGNSSLNNSLTCLKMPLLPARDNFGTQPPGSGTLDSTVCSSWIITSP
jgi:hypothetical protein